MQEIVKEIQKIIKLEAGDKIDALRTEFKADNQSLKNELRNEFNSRFDDLKDEFNNKFDDLNEQIQVLRDCVFVIEQEHGRKIDAIFDLVYLDKELNDPKFKQIEEISGKVDNNRLHILNHEDRISILEKNIS